MEFSGDIYGCCIPTEVNPEQCNNPVGNTNCTSHWDGDSYWNSCESVCQELGYQQWNVGSDGFANDNTFTIDNYSDFKTQINKGGFIRCGWDGSPESENKIKEETKATIRCIPLNQNVSNLNCIYSNRPAQYEVIFSKAY